MSDRRFNIVAGFAVTAAWSMAAIMLLAALGRAVFG